MPSRTILTCLLLNLINKGLSCQQEVIFRPLTGCEQDHTSLSPTLKSTTVASGAECAAQCHRTDGCNAISICPGFWSGPTCRMYGYGSNGTCDSLSETPGCRYMETETLCPGSKQFDESAGECVCSPKWMTGPNCDINYEDCSEAYDDGLRGPSDYMTIQIKPDISSSPFEVECYLDWGGWTKIENRDIACPDVLNSGSQGWSVFQDGFGNLPCGYFLGLEKTYQILQNGVFTLDVHVNGDDGLNGHAYYNNFRLSDGSEEYQIDWDSYQPHSGQPAEDGFEYGEEADIIKGNFFGTHDNDYNNCAAAVGTGWWFGENCSYINLHMPMTTDPPGTTAAAVWPENGVMKKLHMFNFQLKRTG